MDFTALIKKSLSIAWNNRILWLFGFLSGGAGTVSFLNPGDFSFTLPDSMKDAPAEKVQGISRVLDASDSAFSAIAPETWILITLGILIVVLIILLIGIFVTNWAAAALVYSILQRNAQRPTFKKGASAGLKYWWKFYLLALVLGLFILAFIAMIALPAIFLFLLKTKVLAIAYLILAAILLIIFIFVVSVVGSLIISIAQRMIVHRGTGVTESIRLSGGLIKKYLGESVLTYLVAVGLSFGAGFVSLLALLPILAVLVVFFIINIFAGLVMAIPALIILFAAAGFWSAFQAAYWTLFYEHLASKEGW